MMGRAVAVGARRTSGAAAWTPTDLGEDVILWMPRDPASITVTGAGVSEWLDASASATAWTKDVDAARPLYTLNDPDFGERHSLSLNGTSQFLSLATPGSLSDASQSHACYVLIKADTTTASLRTLIDTSSNGGAGGDIRVGFYWTATSNGGRHGVWTGGLANDVLDSVPDTAAQVLGWEVDAAGSTITIYEDGVAIDTAAYGTQRATNSDNSGAIGAAFNGTQLFDGKIGEIVRLNRVLTADERTALVTYLGAGVI
jgi:hypothetical protein